MTTIRYILIYILAIGILWSCDKPKNYSHIPDISFSKLSVKNGLDTIGNAVFKCQLSFDFVDGDGDLGLNDYDTLGNFAPGKEHYYNLYIYLYEKKNGIFVKKEGLTYPYRFKNISKQGTTNPIVKGEMKVDFDLSKTVQYADTCHFRFYIFDRALNQSNTETTNEFYLHP